MSKATGSARVRRVLHVQRVKGIGGSERHLLTLLPALIGRGIDVRMVVLSASGADRFTAELDQVGVSYRVIRAGADVNPVLPARIRSQIRAFRPDLVHTHLIHADLYGQFAAWSMRTPGVSTLHSTHGFYTRRPYRSITRTAFRSATRVVAISHFAAEFVRRNRLVAASRLRVVPYGLPPTPDPDSAVRGRVRQSLGIGPENLVVGMVSRLITGKGHANAIDAIRLALPNVPNVRLLVAGEGPLRASLAAQAADLGEAVRFLGFVEEVQGLLAACDLLLFVTEPMLGEGFGLAALEAMAAARPVIATRVASLPEVVGESGIIVPPESSGDLAAAIETLAYDEPARRRLGQVGQQRAREQYSLAAMVDGTLSVYEDAFAEAS